MTLFNNLLLLKDKAGYTIRFAVEYRIEKWENIFHNNFFFYISILPILTTELYCFPWYQVKKITVMISEIVSVLIRGTNW